MNHNDLTFLNKYEYEAMPVYVRSCKTWDFRWEARWGENDFCPFCKSYCGGTAPVLHSVGL